MIRPIVYFDGLCALCDGFVRFVVARDGLGRFRFAPLQGETAKLRLTGKLDTEGMKTVVLEQEDHALRVKSDAVLAILAGLGHGWQLTGVLRIVPRFLRDWVYDVVAKYRHRWFGKRDACRLPTPAERERFLP